MSTKHRPPTHLLLLFAFCFHLALGGKGAIFGTQSEAVPMKKYTIDLDQSPQDRWIPLLKDFKSSAPLIVDYFRNQVPKDIGVIVEKLMADLNGFFGELGQEMQAIADYFKLDLGIVVSLNFAYELRRLGGGRPNTTGNGTIPPRPSAGGMACTSIVAQDASGNVYHGRNLDWNIPDNLKNLSVQADFLKNGRVVFTGAVMAGFVGILTGMSKSGFSLSINERDLGGNPIIDGFDALLRKAWSPSHLARQVLTSVQSYDEAIEQLKKEPLSAPVYFITAGSQPSQGAVIIRDRNFLRSFLPLHVSLTTDPNSWYLLETNYDFWKQPKSYDNRRYYGNEYMRAAGQENAASVDGLFSVLSRWPIRNNETTYTSLMYPQKFEMNSYNVYIITV